jgi:tetratricopeptide (TPR) repeat protein
LKIIAGPDDTVKVNALNEIGQEYLKKGEFYLADSISDKSLQLARRLEFSDGVARALNNKGKSTYNLGKLNEALDHFNSAISICGQTGNTGDLAVIFTNLGLVYIDIGRYPDGLDCYLKAITIYEKAGNKKAYAQCLGNIGLVYKNQEDYPKALEYYFKAVKMNLELDNEKANAGPYHNIGNIYKVNGDHQKDSSEKNRLYELSHAYYLKARKLNEDSGKKNWLANNYGALSLLYKNQNQFDSAVFYSEKALQLHTVIGDRRGMISDYNFLGLIDLDLGKLKEAETFTRKGLELAEETRFMNYLQTLNFQLGEIYRARKDYKNALHYYRIYKTYRDSLFTESKNDEVTRHEMGYEFAKKQDALKAEQEKREALQAAEKKKRETTIWIISGIVALVLACSFFILRSLRLARRQKEIIEIKTREAEMQKNLIAEKNKDILDSIYYAKRIQQSLMPNEKYIYRKLNS